MFLPDEEILQNFKVKGRENYAFNQLIKKYQEKIYWLIRRMVIDHEDSNDLTQDVFIKVWKNLGDFRSDAKLFTWIYRIAINETLNFLNKKKKRLLIPLVKVERQLENKIDDSFQFNGDELQIKLQKSMLKLPEKQRLVFQLRYYDEMPYEEMSKVLETSEGALKASYHHAAAKIEKYLFLED